MAIRDYIDIDKNEIPVTFDIDFESQTFTMAINYNRTFDYFTVDLWDADGNVIVLGEKLMLNIPLFDDLVDDRLPGLTIVPMDESGQEKRITWDNFYVTVFLYIDDLGNQSVAPSADDESGGDNLGV